MDRIADRRRALLGGWLAISSLLPLSSVFLDPYLFVMATLGATAVAVVVAAVAIRRPARWRWALASLIPCLLAWLLVLRIRWA